MAGPTVDDPWPVEDIPDPARLFLRVHVSILDEGRLVPAIFREQGGSMSVDWEKYSTPEQSRVRGDRPDPTKNGIVALVAGGVRQIRKPPLSVQHSPNVLRKNRAHSDVLGIGTTGAEKTEARAKLFQKFSTWLLPPATSVGPPTD